MISDPFHLLIVFLAVIAVTLALIERSKVAAKISPVILILFFSAFLANIKIIPTHSAFYDQLKGYAVPFAVCQILFHIRFSDIKKMGLPVLKAFAIGSLGSLIGCLAAGVILASPLNNILAGQGWKLAGPYIGTYIGGGLNFNSMWNEFAIENPELYAAANGVDQLTLLPIFIFWIIVPQYLKKWYPKTTLYTETDSQRAEASEAPLKMPDLIKLTLIALLIMALSDFINAHFMIPKILTVTTIALLTAQHKSIKNLKGSGELGNFAFYLFFAVIGAMMDIAGAIKLAPILFVYVVIIIASQVTFVLVVGRLLKMDLRMLAVASIAAKAGPSSVVAYTNAKSWNDLALPGVAAGLLGYAVGNFIAYGGAHLMKAILGQ